MRRNVFLTNIVLCTIALCLQGCPEVNPPSYHYEFRQSHGNVWIYSPMDSLYTYSYSNIEDNPRKEAYYYAPNNDYIMQGTWYTPEERENVAYDEKYHALHVRKLSNKDTTFVISGSSNFYLNDIKCYYGTWIIPEYLYGEPDSLRTMYSFRQIIDSLRVHYPHLITTIVDTEEHIFSEVYVPNNEPLPRIIIK